MIDIHVHLFPDEIAAATVQKLAEEAGITHYGDGTLNSLRLLMKENRVRLSVNQPVATKPGQVRSINRKMVELHRKQLPVISFGAMHPEFAGADEEISFLKAEGFKGIKLHPDYQNFHPDDEKMLPVYEACAKYGIIILFHAGKDLAFPYTHGTPERLKQVLAVRGLTIVLAHMGGYRQWDDVERFLVGGPAFFDTSFSEELENDRLREMILGHGISRIVFGTDSPWDSVERMRSKITALGLGDENERRIFFENSRELLNIPESAVRQEPEQARNDRQGD